MEKVNKRAKVGLQHEHDKLQEENSLLRASLNAAPTNGQQQVCCTFRFLVAFLGEPSRSSSSSLLQRRLARFGEQRTEIFNTDFFGVL